MSLSGLDWFEEVPLGEKRGNFRIKFLDDESRQEMKEDYHEGGPHMPMNKWEILEPMRANSNYELTTPTSIFQESFSDFGTKVAINLIGRGRIVTVKGYTSLWTSDYSIRHTADSAINSIWNAAHSPGDWSFVLWSLHGSAPKYNVPDGYQLSNHYVFKRHTPLIIKPNNKDGDAMPDWSLHYDFIVDAKRDDEGDLVGIYNLWMAPSNIWVNALLNEGESLWGNAYDYIPDEWKIEDAMEGEEIA